MSRETAFNNIGIDERLDWNRIRKLMIIGIFAACMVLVGDMLLGWGLHDNTKPGMEGFLSAYLTLPDSRIFWSAFLGLIGIPLEALCYFSVYRLIAPNSRHYAHLYRTGILGTLAFAGCGVNVPCLACVFFYKYMAAGSSKSRNRGEGFRALRIVFSAAGNDPVLYFLADPPYCPNYGICQRADPLSEMVLDLLSRCRYGFDHAAEIYSGNAAAECHDCRLDQYRQFMDVRRAAGDAEEGT